MLGAAPRDIVFFDDRPANVEAAVAHGWDAHRWAGPAAAIAVLQRRGVLPAR